MWVFSKEGFFSIVCKECDKNEVLVRTRSEEDLLRMFHKLNDRPNIIKKKDGDYKFRTILKKETWVKYLSGCVFDLDYKKVKENIILQDDKARRVAYNAVRLTMYNWLGREAPL
jgi:hypothetical protein